MDALIFANSRNAGLSSAHLSDQPKSSVEQVLLPKKQQDEVSILELP